MQYGDYEGITILRYDNAHGSTKGHERHTRTGTESIEFPGWRELHETREKAHVISRGMNP